MNLNLKTLTTKLFIHTFSKPEWHGARNLAIIYWGLKIQESKSRAKQETDRMERFRVMANEVKSVLVEEIGKKEAESVINRYKIG